MGSATPSSVPPDLPRAELTLYLVCTYVARKVSMYCTCWWLLLSQYKLCGPSRSSFVSLLPLLCPSTSPLPLLDSHLQVS